MSLSESYAQSAVRHFNDADRLAGAHAYHGAGYLIGYAVECAIKTAVESTRPGATAPHAHLPDLVEKAKKMLSGRAHQAILVALSAPDLMTGWSTALRYRMDDAVSEARFCCWRRQAQRIIGAAGLRRAKT